MDDDAIPSFFTVKVDCQPSRGRGWLRLHPIAPFSWKLYPEITAELEQTGEAISSLVFHSICLCSWPSLGRVRGKVPMVVSQVYDDIAAREAEYSAGEAAVRDQQVGLGNPRPELPELLSLRTVPMGTKTCQLGARWRRAVDTHARSEAKPSAPSLSHWTFCVHQHPYLHAHMYTRAYSHLHLCEVIHSQLHTHTRVWPSPYTELSWTATFLSGIQIGPPLTEAASRTIQAIPMCQDSPA